MSRVRKVYPITSERYSTLIAGIAEVLARLDATPEERNALFVDPVLFAKSVTSATAVIETIRSSTEAVSNLIISEARESFGEAAAQQLIAALAAKHGGSVK